LKVGIVTFYTANNYGAVLQCHALYSFLKSQGHEVVLLETDLPNKNKTLRSKLRHSFFNSISFKKFRNNWLPDVVSKNTSVDAVVFGSDQIWNIDITKQFYLEYFGSFLHEKIKRVAYAASFGVASWNHPKELLDAKSEIAKFSVFGIREASGVEICKEQFDVTATKVLDPTLLLEADNYKKLYKLRLKKGQLVSYIFNKDAKKIEDVKKLASSLSLKPVLLSDVRIRKGILSVPYPSVSTWVSYLAAADFVVTDSFHCMVFAIINQKNFVAIPAIKARAGRMTSLLSDLGLLDRFFEDIKSAQESGIVFSDIDYSKVNIKLDVLREESRQFLISSISE
jgi:hypothetical protein